MKIEDAQELLARRFAESLSNTNLDGLPIGKLRPVVSLRHPGDKPGDKSRQVRSNGDLSSSWNPERDIIVISFESHAEPEAETKARPVIPAHPPDGAASVPTQPSTPTEDLVKALDRLDGKMDFVALKWFRDVFLPSQKLDWTSHDKMRHAALKEAIERQWILTSKIPNPNSPDYPTTALRVNRALPVVQSILSRPDRSLTPAGSLFNPVRIAGKPLSATVLEERR